jgi:hypothetical protein
MLFAVPNQPVCGPAAEGENMQAGCDPEGQATSNRNRFHGNVMGRAPGGASAPNGTDFWWDQYPGNTGNCWYSNRGNGEITSSPPRPFLPDCNGGRNPESSVGTGNPANEGELGVCAIGFVTGDFDPNGPCPWFRTPEKPGTRAARSRARQDRAAVREGLVRFCDEFGSSRVCR